MNQIQQLINQMCPNGVEWKTLGEVLKYEQPTKYIVDSTNYSNEGTPVLTAGASFILGYTKETNGIYTASKDNPVIIFDDFTTSFHWVNFDFKVKSSAMKMLKPINDEVNFRYVYYSMCTINYVPTEHSRQWISTYSKFQIPVPPLEIQTRIVEILDHFTNLTANLTAELNLRRKQFEHYREKLLSLDGVEGVEWKKLGEVCLIKGRIGFRGYTRSDQVTKGEGVISLSPGNINNFRLNYDDCTYITYFKYNESPEIKTYNGDIIFCKTGSTVGKVAVVVNLPCEATINPQLVVLKEIKCYPRFLFYLLSANEFQSKVKALAGIGSVPNIGQAKLETIPIPLPPLAVQQSIVESLDKFTALIENIENELALRQKQYEYYREQLLTFKS